MAVSVEPGEPTDDLDLARRALDDLHDEVETLTPWQWSPDLRVWFLALELRPTDLRPDGPIPRATRWFVLASPLYPLGHIDVMPAKDGGITQTFPHQLPNDAGGAEVPWREGKVCLVDIVHGHELAAKRDEPTGAYERLVWNVWRMLEWLRRASRNELMKDGEPFELPVFGQFQRDGTTVAFYEGEATFARWSASDVTSGLADLVSVAEGNAPEALAVRRWTDLRRRPIHVPGWGRRIEGMRPAQTAVWFRFPRLLVRPPWRAPRNWNEVLEYADEQGIHFPALLRQTTSAIRDGNPHYVLLGFPIPRTIGETPSRYAWVAFLLPALTVPRQRGRRAPAFPGFRPEAGAWIADRTLGGLANAVALPWVRTENWHPDELAARGRFDGGLASRGIVLLGAGALGSILADLLVRAGATRLTILDDGRVEAGNLARHVLTMTEVGARKASSLAERLNRVSPNARVVGLDMSFPPSSPAVEAIRNADLVIDATTSDTVISALGNFDWGRDMTFASVSFSYGAELLYLYLAAGPTFPGEHFREALRPWIKADERPPEDFPHEGIGCWSSVFPARADDVALLAAVAARQLDERTARPCQEPHLVVYGRNADGTVSILDRPPTRS